MSRWLYAAVRPHERVVFRPSGVSRTRQEFAAECDINNIMKKYQKTGVLSHFSPRQPQYLDLGDGVPDLMTAMNTVLVAERAFSQLPAVVRKEFDNDPTRFVDYAQNSENLPKLREWGLAPPEAAPEPPMRVEVVNPAPAPQA